MITTKEIIRILETEELPDEERDSLEVLLQERAEEELKKFSEGKTVVVKMATEVESLVDFIDLSEKMRETGSDDVETLIKDLLRDRLSDMSGVTGWSEYDIVEDNNN